MKMGAGSFEGFLLLHLINRIVMQSTSGILSMVLYIYLLYILFCYNRIYFM
jgi:hypothetical protein